MTTSNSLVLGSVNTNVGIGTSGPVAKLEIAVNSGHILLGNAGCFLGFNGIGFGSSLSGCSNYSMLGNGADTILNRPSSGSIFFRESNVDQMAIISSGKVGIGTNSPDALLTVNGSADKPSGGSWGTFSDERLKNLKGRFTPGVRAIMQLQPLRYEYKPANALGIKSSGEHIGFSAQAVQKIIPEAVTKNDKGYLLINNDPILWTMLNAIKEQQAQFMSQEREIEQERERNARQQNQLTQQQ